MPYFPIFSCKLVSLIKRKPMFATWHETVGLSAWQHYIGRLPGVVAYFLERLSVLLPDHIIAVSSRTGEQVRELLKYRGAMSVVTNGIDYKAIANVKASSLKSDVVYAGRLVKHKNVDFLIRAVAILKDQHPNLTCVIIGDGPEFANLKQLVHNLKLEAHVTLTGRLSNSKDVYALMKASRLFVSPSLREGFGITILEAYACGLLPITVRHPNNAAQYLVRTNAGAICEPTPEALAKTIDKLLDKPQADWPTIDASQFDWAKSAAALQEVYGL